jgi:Bacterial PH domain
VTTVKNDKDQAGREVYRSPAAIAIWWLWLLFAVANLIDLAVQGHDHLSLVAALTLVLITGVVYVTAQRPRVIASPDALTIVNPLRDHRIEWPALVGADSTDLLRVRCQWPDGPAADEAGAAPAPAPAGKRAIYAWAVHSSRRRQVAAEMRAKRQEQRGNRGRTVGGFAGGFGGAGLGAGLGGGLGLGGNLGSATATAPEPDPLTLDASKIVTSLTEHAERARADDPAIRPAAPVTTWYWPGIAAIGVPALVLLLVALT